MMCQTLGSNYMYILLKTELLKPVLEGVASDATFITGHEQAQLNRVCLFLFLWRFPRFQGSNFRTSAGP